MIMQEITRRLNILNKKKVPVVDATMLRQGGMQGRVHRQEIARYARQIQAQKQITKPINFIRNSKR